MFTHVQVIMSTSPAGPSSSHEGPSPSPSPSPSHKITIQVRLESTAGLEWATASLTYIAFPL